MTSDGVLMVNLLYIGREGDARSVGDHLERDAIEARVRVAGDREAVLRALQEETQWSAVIADETLPGWSAFEALQLVHDRHPNLPFLILSAAAGEEHAIDAMRAGASDCIARDRLGLLAPALRRELREAATRSERSHLFNELRHNKERYRSTFERAPIGIANIGTDGRFRSVNEYFSGVTGYSKRDLIGRRFEELVHPDDIEDAEIWQAQIEGLRTTVEHERRLLHKDGHTVWVRIAFTPIFGDEGEIEEIIALVNDLTAQQLTSNLQLLLESTAEGIVAVDVDGRCQLVNRSAARMLGTSEDELTGVEMHEVSHNRYADGSPRSVEDCPIMEVLHTGATLVIADDTFWRADGTPFPVEYSAAPLVEDGNTIGVVVTFSDISERLKLEAKLEQDQRLSSLGRLAATVAHEFNNVLMGIAPFLEVIRRTTSRERIESALGQMSLSLARGKRITGEILRFTQPAALSRARVAVAEWLSAVSAEAHSLLPPSCTLDVVSEEGLAIDGDVRQLHQMLTNLILNARDAMPAGGVLTIRASREPAEAKFPFGIVERPERFVHLSVRDTGTGMTEETRRHIFEPLFTTRKSGTGLGLSLAHQIVARHGGEIFVESVPGGGTTFHIFVPALD